MISMRFVKGTLALLLLTLCSTLIRAQVADEAIEVPVKFMVSSVTANSRTSAEITATLNGAVATDANDWTGGGFLKTPIKTAILEVGKPYSMVVNTLNTTTKTVLITPPPGYLLSVNGIAKTSFTFTAGTAAYTVRIIPPEGAVPQPAGAVSSITGGRIKWSIALGSLLSGESADSISVVGAATSDWSPFFTPSTVYYEPQSDEIYVYRISGNIRQISANEAFVDIVTLSATSYEMRFYQPASATGLTYPKSLTGLPFVTYRITQDGSATKLRITKETRTLLSATDTTAPIARTEWTTIQRTGTPPAFTWTVVDWILSGQAALASEVRTWTSNASGGHDETIRIVEPDNSTAARATRVHTHFAWGDTPTNTTAGIDTSITNWVATDYTYNTDSANEASYGFVNSVQSTGGAWTAYDYFPTTDDLKVGTISTTYAPFVSSPATVTRSASSGVVTSMTYAADPFGMLRRLSTSESRVNGTLTAKTSIAYTTATVNSMTVVAATRQDQVNSAGATLTSITRSYQEDTGDAFFRNQPHAVISPDRTAQSFIRQLGTWSGGTFTPSTSGTASRIGTVSGVADNTSGTQLLSTYTGYTLQPLYLVPTKSTLDLVIRDSLARIARTESYVWDGSVWQLINWSNFTYNQNNQLTSRVASNGDTYDAAYSGELKLWERDGTGIKVSYTYDNAGRVKAVTKEGANGLPDLVTESTYDAADRVVKQETYAASGSTEKLTSTRAYDLASRPVSETAPGVGTTTYAYDPVNRTQTVTAPSLATSIQTAYLDGQPRSVTGTGVVAQYFTYGIESDGRRWTQVNLATSSSVRWSKSWTDWLGRSEHSERPGFTGQANYVEQATYHATTGQLIKTERSGMADTLYTYNALGQPVLSGLDINANGTLDLASADRITGQEKWFTNESSAWWLATRSYTYATLNSATETTLGSTRERLTGFTGNLRSESRATDAEGNTATSTVSVDRTTRTVTKTTQAPGLSSPAVETAVNGLGTTGTTPDGLVFTTGYDVLQRPVTSTNVRAGVTRTATTAYEPSTARPLTITDPAGTVTATYSYDIMGRKSSVKNADNKYVRFVYTARSELAQQWGEATSPVSFGYSTYGERTTLTTYRTDGAWDGATWPGSPPSGDTTTWAFDGPSGLLTKKTDATSRYVEYDYNERGQVLHRYWARTLDGTINTARVTATYTYDDETGEPLSTTYNDSTPSVTTTYTRLGQAATLSDYTGTRTFDYDNTSPWRHDTTTLPAFYNSYVFKSLYETTTSNSGGTVKGRVRGFQLGSTTTPASVLEQTYAVNALGRLTGITSARGNGAASQAFAYGYLTDSRLLSSVAATGTAFTTTRAYETQRDLLTSIKGQWSTTIRSEFTYTHDTFGRRVTAAQDGDAYSADYGDTTRQRFAYNDRGELTDATGCLGTEATANELPGRKFQYGYDAAGNRTSANHTGDSTKADTFTVNSLNQLTDRQNKAVSVSGVASTDATVVADDQPAARKGRFWQFDILQPEVALALSRSLTTVAAKPGAGTGGADLAQIDRRFVFLPGYTESLAYDADGNLTSDAKWTYTWDAENRLLAMEGKAWMAVTDGPPRQRLEFNYDAMGRRVFKKVLSQAASPGTWTLASETRFFYDGWNLLGEFALNPQTGSFNLSRSYTWGLDLTGSMTAAGGVGGLLQITDHTTSTSYLPTYDGNGNVATLVNAATGALGASYEYNAFGEPLRAAGSYAKANPFRFSTKFTDNETGLIYYGCRYYDAHNGRFINRDPIEERGGMNLYGFCSNDGINRYDVLGMDFLGIGKALKKIGKWVKKNWTSVVGAALMFVPGIGPALSVLWSAAVGYVNGGIKGMLIGAATSYIGAQIGGVIGGKLGIGNQFLSKTATGALSGGFAGGAAAMAGGGNFGDGFMAGAITGGVLSAGTALARNVFDSPNSSANTSVNRDSVYGKISYGINSLANGLIDLEGKLWNLPNTTVGIAFGMVGVLFGGDLPRIDHNAIEFWHNPFVSSAITLGNTISYGRASWEPATAGTANDPAYSPPLAAATGNSRLYNGLTWEHEIQHTYQGQLLGPLYLPSNLLAMGMAQLINGDEHGALNWNERGPQSSPPRTWNFKKSYPW